MSSRCYIPLKESQIRQRALFWRPIWREWRNTKGQSVGGTIPLGYRTVDKRLDPDPKTAPLIKQIFEMYAAGSTQKEIVDHLNAEGLRNRRGSPLTVNSIRAVLKNKKYIGIYHYDGKEYPDVNFPALIDAETFDKVRRMPVQNRLASNGTIDLLLGKI